jgi:hypothetical protein
MKKQKLSGQVTMKHLKILKMVKCSQLSGRMTFEQTRKNKLTRRRK